MGKKEEETEIEKKSSLPEDERIKYLASYTEKPVIFRAMELMVDNLHENIQHMTEHWTGFDGFEHF